MEIRQYDSGLLSSNMFVVVENGHAIVIDPARDTSAGKGLVVDLLIVTHEHYDHISGVNQWKACYQAPLLCSERCAERLMDPKMNQARYFDVLCELQAWVQLENRPQMDTDYSCRADRTFHDETAFLWQGHRFRLQEIPGHSPGSIGIFLDEINFFSGDSMLEGREVELRFPGGSRQQWKELGEKRIRAIPKGTRIWPGHFRSFFFS